LPTAPFTASPAPRPRQAPRGIAQRPYLHLHHENSGDWIIDDVDDEKVGQFTARNSGVRKAILEFEHDAEGLTSAEIAGLSWFTRVILDANTQGKAWAWIIALVLASIVALVALFVL